MSTPKLLFLNGLAHTKHSGREAFDHPSHTVHCRDMYPLSRALLGGLLLVRPIGAQAADAIRSDRPGQANSPYTVGRAVLQGQSGLEFGASRVVHGTTRASREQYQDAATTLRFGVARRIEVNTTWALRRIHRPDSPPPQRTRAGVSQIQVASRVNVLDAVSSGTAIGMQLGLALPITSQPFRRIHLAPSYLLMASQALGSRLTATANLGAQYDGNSTDPVGLYVVNVGWVLNTRWSAFAESFGQLGPDATLDWDTGISFLASRNVQWDVFGRTSRARSGPRHFVSTGVSWRTPLHRPSVIQP